MARAPPLQHRPGRGEVVGKRVVDEIALAQPRREERPCQAKRIGLAGCGLEDGTRGGKYVGVILDRAGYQPPERRRLGLQRHQLRLPNDRERGQRTPVGYRVGVDAFEQAGDRRCTHRDVQVIAERLELRRIARRGGARFKGVVVIGVHVRGSMGPNTRQMSRNPVRRATDAVYC